MIIFDEIKDETNEIESKQFVTFQYRHPAKAEPFNTLLKGAIQPGIYEGGELKIHDVNFNSIEISPFIVYCLSGDHTMVKVETSEKIVITVPLNEPVIYAFFEFEEHGDRQDYENHLRFGTRESGSILIPNEIIFGECHFLGNDIEHITYEQRMDQPTSGYEINKGSWQYEIVNKEKKKVYTKYLMGKIGNNTPEEIKHGLIETDTIIETSCVVNNSTHCISLDTNNVNVIIKDVEPNQSYIIKLRYYE